MSASKIRQATTLPSGTRLAWLLKSGSSINMSFKVDGSGRITIRNRKFLRQYVPVVMTPARHTIDDDLHSLPKTSTPNPSNTQTDSDINLPPPPAKLDTQSTPPPPDHDETTPPQIIPENTQPTPQQTIPHPSNQPTPNPPTAKPPLALRRLGDYNNKGLKE